MKITAIKPQLKKSDRVSIFVDGEYSFSLSQSEMLRQQLSPNQNIDKTRLRQLIKLSSEDKAYINTLRYVSLRPRSEWEVKTYLDRKKFKQETVELILNKLSNLGLINDPAFAKSWIENRQLLKPRSSRLLKQELRKKNIAKEVIDSALSAQPIDETANIIRIVENKRKQPKYRDDQKIIQYLARQGFNYGDIKTALSSLNSSRSSD
ncbi:MAG TPA: RecX family transcriptional regulator [Patescibacteria group bacterium]|jgi:regulatory protein|nr:RecX family transcriptional regulator [Patescibacteria group bacterium]